MVFGHTRCQQVCAFFLMKVSSDATLSARLHFTSLCLVPTCMYVSSYISSITKVQQVVVCQDAARKSRRVGRKEVARWTSLKGLSLGGDTPVGARAYACLQSHWFLAKTYWLSRPKGRDLPSGRDFFPLERPILNNSLWRRLSYRRRNIPEIQGHVHTRNRGNAA